MNDHDGSAHRYELCPACDSPVDDSGVAPGGILRCAKCNTRFAKLRKATADVRSWSVRDDVERLGIHPALARKYQGSLERTAERDVKPAAPEQVTRVLHGGRSDEGRAASARDDAREAHPLDGAADRAVDRDPLGRVRGRLDEDALRASPSLGPSPFDSDAPGSTNPARPSRKSMEGPAVERRATPRAAPGVGAAADRPFDDARAPAMPPAPAAAAAPAPKPAKEEPVDILPVIPGYDVLELIGKGAMGRVYRAHHIASGRAAAIKILASELASRQDFIQRFEREGAAMRAVKHPGVVAVLDQGAVGYDGPNGPAEHHFIAMDFVDGAPLRRQLDRGALSPDRALTFARAIVQALGAAHDRGVIHRDLKPENILVVEAGTEAMRLVIVDFGLAGILDEENDPHPNLTKSRMTMGTVNYMAPEQRTDAKRVDQRADLYAAGVIFYELLTGDLPLGRFALPTERGVPVPVTVDRVIVRALARNPDERYQRAQDLDRDLRAIEHEMRKSAQTDTVIGRVRGTPSNPGSEGALRSLVEDAVSTGDVVAVSSRLSSPSLSIAGSATAWVTAAPWLGRPALASAGLALAIGTLLGLLALRGGCAL